MKPSTIIKKTIELYQGNKQAWTQGSLVACSIAPQELSRKKLRKKDVSFSFCLLGGLAASATNRAQMQQSAKDSLYWNETETWTDEEGYKVIDPGYWEEDGAEWGGDLQALETLQHPKDPNNIMEAARWVAKAIDPNFQEYETSYFEDEEETYPRQLEAERVVIEFNDSGGRKHGDILKVLRRAYKAAIKAGR